MESYGVSGQVDWDLGRATLTSITAYRWWDWYPANDTDGTALSINTKGQHYNFQRQFSQELRLASNGDEHDRLRRRPVLLLADDPRLWRDPVRHGLRRLEPESGGRTPRRRSRTDRRWR